MIGVNDPEWPLLVMAPEDSTNAPELPLAAVPADKVNDPEFPLVAGVA